MKKSFKLEDLEYSVAKKIKELVDDRGCHYKQAYTLIKKELLELKTVAITTLR